MIPKKSLGQHWLEDRASLESVAEAGMVHEHDTVLEVGPGLGTLTRVLAEKAHKVIAVEFDGDLATELRANLTLPNVQIIEHDILKFDLTEMPPKYKVVANIPYYLTSNLLRTLSESRNPPKLIALLVQKEVAQRICASPREMSLLSVSVQMYYQAHLEQVIKAEMFAPPPKVDSQIVQLVRRPEPLFGTLDSKKLFRIVKAGFSNRRKTLLNSLSGGLGFSKEEIAKNLQIVDIDPGTRAQELSLQEWTELAKILD